jgi:hypothetical protein
MKMERLVVIARMPDGTADDRRRYHADDVEPGERLVYRCGAYFIAAN